MAKYRVRIDSACNNKNDHFLHVYCIKNNKFASFSYKQYVYFTEDELKNTVFLIYEQSCCEAKFKGYIFGEDIIHMKDSMAPLYRDSFKHNMIEFIDLKNMHHNRFFAAHMHKTGLSPCEYGKVYNIYKGTDEDMMCKNMQYELNTKYHDDNCLLCESGLHACIYPIDCLLYYPPSFSKYFKGTGKVFDILHKRFNNYSIRNDELCCWIDSKGVFSEICLQEQMTTKDIILYMKDIIVNPNNNITIDGLIDQKILENIGQNEESLCVSQRYGSRLPIFINTKNPYTYIRSNKIGISNNYRSIVDTMQSDAIAITLMPASIAYSRLYSGTAIADGVLSIAYAESAQSIAIANSQNSKAETDDSYSVSYSKGSSSSAIANGKHSIAISYINGKIVSNKEKSVSIGMDFPDLVETNGKESIAVGYDSNRVNVNGNGSIGISYDSHNVFVAKGSMAVVMLKENEYGSTYITGELDSYIVINIISEDDGIIKSMHYHVDGEKIKPNISYVYDSGELVEANEPKDPEGNDYIEMHEEKY